MPSEFLTTPSRATDANDNPASGAKWLFYASGTTTPQSVYSDSDLTASLGAEVDADSSGQFPPIYMDASKSYRADLVSADKSETYFSADPINDSAVVTLSVLKEDVEASAAAAAESEQNAAASEAQAGIYAQAAAVNGTIYADEATGRAAVSNGEYYTAIGANSDNAIDVWLRVDASNSTLQTSFPSSLYFQEVIDAVAVDSSKGGRVAANAVGSSQITNNVGVGENLALISSSVNKWGKAFDAHLTLDDDENIKIGRLISHITTYAKIPATATDVRAKVYTRATTENGLPGGAYDTLIADTGAVVLADAEWVYDAAHTGYGLYSVGLPEDQKFIVGDGLSYLFLLEFQDSGSGYAIVSCSIPYYSPGVNYDQRLAGYVDTSGSWSNQNLGRPVCLGYGEAEYNSLNAVKATADMACSIEKAQSQADILPGSVRLFLQNNPWSHWKYPGNTTVAYAGNEGLSNALGSATWGSGGYMMGVEGVDFGALTAEGSMSDLTTTQYWDGSRLNLKPSSPFNAAGGFSFNTAKLVGGYIDASISSSATITLTDCLIDADGGNIIYGIQQAAATSNICKIVGENLTIVGFVNASVTATNASFKNCFFDFTANDIINGGSGGNVDGRELVFEGCLMRRPASQSHPYANPSAHGDIWQVTGGKNWLIGCVLYMVAEGVSGYSEGANGTTAGIATGNQGEDVFSNLIIGCVIGAGFYNQYIQAAAGVTVKNYGNVHNIYLGGGDGGGGDALGIYENYNGSSEVIFYESGAGATLNNIYFFGNRAADGYPVRFADGSAGDALPILSSVPAHTNGQPITLTSNSWTGDNGSIEGIFDYDWDELDDEHREVILSLGRSRGEDIIDPLTKRLNPKYDLGNLGVA